MIKFTVKEIESSTETNSYCTIVADIIPNDIVSIFGQNAYLYTFGKPEFWEILSYDKNHISRTIGMEYVDTSCEHVVRYLHRPNSNIASIEITNTVMGSSNYDRTLSTLKELGYEYDLVLEEIGDINHPQATNNGKPTVN